MIWDLIRSAVHGDARWIVAIGGVAVLTLTFDRLAEMVSLGVAITELGRPGEKRRGLTATLWDCLETVTKSAGTDRVEALAAELRIRLPQVHARWWTHHDPATAYLAAIAPLAGMFQTLARLWTDPRPSVMVGEGVGPTAVGIIIALLAMLLAMAMQVFDFPSKLTRALVVQETQAKQPGRSASVVLRSHSGPLLFIFFLAWADFCTGAWVRSQAVSQLANVSPPSLMAEVSANGLSAAPVYLELLASPEQFSLAGQVLPPNPSEMLDAVRRVVIARSMHGQPEKLVRIVVLSRPDVTVGTLQRVKAAIQSAILEHANENVVVRFEDCVDFGAASRMRPGENSL